MRKAAITINCAIAASLLFLSACTTTWSYSDGPVSASGNRYSISLPQGWTYIPLEGRTQLLATHDGPELQAYRVLEYDLSEELPYSKNMIQADISIMNLTDAVFKEIFKSPGINGPTLESAGPGKLDTADGFEMVYSYSNEEGLRYRGLSTGAIRGDRLYIVTYSAPVRHYFDRYDDTVDKTLASFKFL